MVPQRLEELASSSAEIDRQSMSNRGAEYILKPSRKEVNNEHQRSNADGYWA